MGLAITDDHLALADSVRKLAADHTPLALARALAEDPSAARPAMWDTMAAVGWFGLHIPEEYGGSGFGLPELAVVVEELGYTLTPGPFLATVVASATLAAVGAQSQRRYLTGLADGSLSAGIGFGANYTRDDPGGDTGLVTGGLVLGGRWADVFLLPVGDDLLVVDRQFPGLTVDAVSGMDPSLGLVRVFLDGGPDAGSIIAGGARPARRHLRALAAAEAAGGARACLDTAVRYATVREQFGRPIGGFQAVKHHLANMFVAMTTATAVSWDAARAGDGAQGDFAAASAATLALPAYQDNAQKMIQVLGGVGFTWEHDAHLFLRRAVSLHRIVAGHDVAADELYQLAASGIRPRYGVDLPPSAEAYRVEARAFRQRYLAAAPEKRRRVLAESGYLAPHWPAPFGRGAGAVEQLVIDEELDGIDSPALGIGTWLLPTLIQTASGEQLERWIFPSLIGELTWCQLFSEPDAGSDAAAVRTKAVRVAGGWSVSGQKVWTSAAQRCNRGLATVRTNPSAPKHRGITAMVVDMHAPGVTVRPLREITGDALFNEVYFDGVFVPDGDVVGEVDGGWSVARATLGNERVSIGATTDENMSAYEGVALAAEYGAGAAEQREIARLIAQEHAIRLVNLRQVTRAVSGSAPGAEGIVTKLLTAEHAQRVAELAMTIAGRGVLADSEERVRWHYLYSRCLTIAGGTSEISRNVIGERILGLPREPSAR
jgi:3-oxochol-4-en-24-oyl-CoA dehydrogenase